MTIARKLWLGFGALILVFVVASLIIFSSERLVSDALDEIANVEEPTQDAAYEMEINAVEISRDVLEYLDTGDPRYREQFEDDRADFEEFQARHAELVDTPTGREHVEQIDSLYQEYVAAGQNLLDEYDEQGGNSGESFLEDELEFLELQASLDDTLDGEVQPWSNQQLEEAEEDAMVVIFGVYVTIAVLLLLGLLVGGLAAFLINRGIIRSIYRLNEGARRIGQGNLEHRIELNTADEFGEVAATFNEMAERRQKAEEELHKSEARNRAVVVTAPDAIITMTTNGLIQSFNPGAERIFGYAEEEAVGQPLKMLMPERFRGLHEAGFRRYLEGGEAHVVGKGSVELAGLRKNGEEFPLELSLGEMREEDDILFTGIIRDVTERKWAEEELQESQRRFEQLFNQSVDALVVHDETGRIVDCNTEAYRSLGYSKEELLSLSVADFSTNVLSPEQQAAKERDGGTLWQRAVASEPGTVVGVHYGEHRRKDGTTFPVEVRVSSVDYAGRRMVLAAVRDITERKRAEEALRRETAVVQLLEMVALTANEAPSLEEAMQTCLELVWSHTEWPVGHAYLVNGGATSEAVSTNIWFLEDPEQFEDFVKATEGSRFLPGVGLAGKVLASREPAWIRDVTEDPNFPRAQQAKDAGIRSGIAVPVLAGSEIAAVLEFFSTEVVEPDNQLLEALTQVGVHLGRVIERRQSEEEIRQLNEELEDRVEQRTTQLRETEERYALVLEGSNEGFFDWRIPEGEIYWNDRMFEIAGLSRSTFTPTLEGFFELVHPEDRESLQNSLNEHLEHGGDFEEELRMRHSSGEYRYLVVRAKAQRDEDGNPYRMAGPVSDITERKRSELAQRFLAEASAELASSLDYRTTLTKVADLSVPRLADWCAVDILQDDGSLERLAIAHEDPEKIRWARELQERYPTPSDAPYGLPNVLRTGEPEMMQEIPESLLEETIQDTEQLEILRELGLESYMIVPLIARGRTLGAITFVMADSGRRYDSEDLELAEELARRAQLAVDNARLYEAAREEIEERERAQEEIRRLNQSLERRVEERTAQLENTVHELERARVVAEEANRAKSDFLANMSHEIRTPMNGVIGMIDLLLGTSLSDEQKEYAETVRLSAENLLTIINDILDFSKIEAGKMRIETIDFDLRVAVEEVVALLAERAHDKGLELASLIEYDVPTALKGDPGRIRQVLTNLVGNAIKFTEEGNVVVRARLLEENDKAATVRFEVQDTGIGMSEDQQQHIFQSFSQADTSTTRKYGGTGLGLTISRQLVELMGGEMSVESEPGVGSTFFFTLLLKKQPAGARAPSVHPTADIRDQRALIVDDNATNREILHKQLSSWGMKNESVESGSQALSELRSAAESGEPYNLGILDMEMPEMNGMQLARAIKDDPAISQTRLILLTSAGRRGEGEEARRSGIEAYLPKPVKQSELYDTLATVMSEPVEATSEEETQLVTRHTLREQRAGARAHLLVAEDNPVNQRVAVRILENLGYRVDVAANGREALEALSRSPYAAVLMDVQMPEMDGYEATAEIRRRETGGDGDDGRHTPVIAMTANAMQGDREKALQAGMDDYVAKPIRPEELDEILNRWVSDERETPEPEAPLVTQADGSTSQDSEGPLDEEVLAGLRELGDADLLAELVEVFFEDVPPRLAALKEATESGDAESVERVAHTLKGSCGNMGARRMAQICAELQDTGTSADLSRAPELLEQLEAEFGRVRPALEAEVARSRD